MKKLIAAIAMIGAFAVTAQAGEFKLQVRPQLDSDARYVDTYPADLAGTKAIRIVANGFKAAGSRASLDIGRVYFKFEGANGFSAYTKVNVNLKVGETTAWIAIPKVGGATLKSVRVYVQPGYPYYDVQDLGPGNLIKVIGLK